MGNFLVSLKKTTTSLPGKRFFKLKASFYSNAYLATQPQRQRNAATAPTIWNAATVPTIRIRLPSSNFYGSTFNEERSSHRYSLYFQGLRPSQHPMRRLRRRDITTMSAYHNRAKQPIVRSNRCVLKQQMQRARRKRTWKKDLSLQERNQGEKVHARTRKLPSHSSQDENRQRDQCIKDSMDLATVRRVRLHLLQRLESAIVCLLVCLRQGYL